MRILKLHYGFVGISKRLVVARDPHHRLLFHEAGSRFCVLLIGIFLSFLFIACESEQSQTVARNAEDLTPDVRISSGNQTKVDSLNFEISLLKEDLKKAYKDIEDLKAASAKEQGNRSTIFLLKLLLIFLLIVILYLSRNQIRRLYQQMAGIDHGARGNSASASHGSPVQDQRSNTSLPTQGAKSDEIQTDNRDNTPLPSKSLDVTTTPQVEKPLDSQLQAPNSTSAPTLFPAPAVAAEKLAERTTKWENVTPISPTTPIVYYAYGAVNGMLEALGEEDYNERVTFKLRVATDGQTATYTVVNNERQQRNVIENQAAYAEAVEYRGGKEGGFASANVQPGKLVLAENRWRIVSRLIIDRS